jgi:hypothetical protein
MAESECVNDGTFGAVKANLDILDAHGVPANIEGLGGESVPRNRCCGSRRARRSGQCDVDARWVLVGELVASEGACQADGCEWRPTTDFD